jgi:hypothetical protein
VVHLGASGALQDPAWLRVTKRPVAADVSQVIAAEFVVDCDVDNQLCRWFCRPSLLLFCLLSSCASIHCWRRRGWPPARSHLLGCISFIGIRDYEEAGCLFRKISSSVHHEDVLRTRHSWEGLPQLSATTRLPQMRLLKIAAYSISWSGAQRAAFRMPSAASVLQGFHRQAPWGNRGSPHLSCPEQAAARRHVRLHQHRCRRRRRGNTRPGTRSRCRGELVLLPRRGGKRPEHLARADASRPRLSEWQSWRRRRRRRQPRRHHRQGNQAHRRCLPGTCCGGCSRPRPRPRERAPVHCTPGPAAAARRAGVHLLEVRKARPPRPRPSPAPWLRGLGAPRPG